MLSDFKLFVRYSYNFHNLKVYKKTNKIFFYKFFSLCMDMVNKYCHNHKERLQKKAHKKYQNLYNE